MAPGGVAFHTLVRCRSLFRLLYELVHFWQGIAVVVADDQKNMRVERMLFGRVITVTRLALRD